MRARCSDGMPTPVSETSTSGLVAAHRGRHRQPAALRHRVAGVEKADSGTPAAACTPRPGPRRPSRRGRLPHLHPVRAELVLEQGQHVADDDVQVDRTRVSPPDGRARLSRLLTIFAARNVCCSIFSSSCVRGSSGVGPVEQHLGEARDAGQRRVDLVGHAGREQADRRHLLRQPELLLEVRAIGDVLEHDNPAGLRAVRRSGTARSPVLTSSVRRSSPPPVSSGTR